METLYPLTISTFQTKSELVYQAVRRMIMHGEMKPGDRVVVGRIAKQLNVSDTPVREAIKQLVSDGFLEESVHVGAIVPVFTLEEVKETFYMRGALAALAVRLNASFYTAEVVERIDNILAQGAQYLAADDTDNFGAVNTLFHANLFATGRFKYLHNTYLGLMRKTDRFRAGFRGHVWNMARSHAAHLEIRAAIVSGDFDRAADLIEKHEVESMQPLVTFLSSKEQYQEQSSHDLMALVESA